MARKSAPLPQYLPDALIQDAAYQIRVWAAKEQDWDGSKPARKIWAMYRAYLKGMADGQGSNSS